MGDMYPPKSKKSNLTENCVLSICRIFPDTYRTELSHLLQKHLRQEEPNLTSHWDPHAGRKHLSFIYFFQKEGDCREKRYFIMYFNSQSFYLPAQMSSYRWIVQENMVDPYHGIVLSNKKESTTGTYSVLDGAQGSHAEWKGPISRWQSMWYHLYGSLLQTENIAVAAAMRGSIR